MRRSMAEKTGWRCMASLMVLPVLMSSLDAGDGLLDEGVADEAVPAECEGFEDGDAGAVKDGQVVRETGEGQHEVQLAKDRQAQLEVVHRQGHGAATSAGQWAGQSPAAGPAGAATHQVCSGESAAAKTICVSSGLLTLSLSSSSRKLGDDEGEEEQHERR